VAIYDNTPESSTLRTVLAKFLYETSDMAVTPEQRKIFPSELLWDIVDASRKAKIFLGGFISMGSPKSNYLNMKQRCFCKYHHDHIKMEDRPAITQEQRDRSAAK
jgi:hypothetical protein